MTLPEFDRDIRVDPDAEWELEEHLERMENRYLGRFMEEQDERYSDPIHSGGSDEAR